MRRPPSTARRVALAAGAVLIAAAWFTWLRPTALGGDASYVIVQGRSMEPTYEDGDLVLVRQEQQYHRGDVIAFRAGGTFDDPTRIIHRIVGDAGDGAFRTQGDNRDVVDPWQPGEDDIIGRAVLHVPMAGRASELLVRPETIAALGGAAVVVGGQRRRRRRHQPRHAADATVPLMAPPPPRAPRPAADVTTRLGRATQPRWAFIGLVVSVVLALPVLALAWSALRASDATQRIEPVGRIDAGIGISYRFSGSPSAVYPDGEVEATRNAAGAVVATDPLYSRLLDDLEVELTFGVEAEGADRLVTTYAVDVRVATPDGWSAPLASVEPTELDGTEVVTIPIDLREVAQRVAAVGDLTGVGGTTHTISLLPRIDLSGGSDLGEVAQQVTTPISFQVEDNLITPTALEVAQREELTRTVDVPARFEIGPLELATQAARGLTGGAALVLVAGIAWFASVLFGGVGLGEAARIAARYRSQIVDVASAAAPPGPVVMVSAIDELARIAKVEQTVIVHEDLGVGAHRYRVFLGSVTYEYETAPEHAGAAEIEQPMADETGT